MQSETITPEETEAPSATPSRNIRSSNPVIPRGAKTLLAESEDEALEWWDHTRNDEKTLRTVTLRATRSCHWICPECQLSFEERVLEMTVGRHSCPDCSEKRRAEWAAKVERFRTTPVADVPELAAAWADDSDPKTVMVSGDGPLRRFRCPVGHHPRLDPLRFLMAGCPSCRALETRRTQKNWLADILPEIASQWHPTLNGKLTPRDLVWDSKKIVQWKADCCGHEWEDSPRNRDKYERLRCPKCKTILGSLAWQDPGLAAEWSPSNPLRAWDVRPHAATSFLPQWICATDPSHVWDSPLSARSSGAECPDCRVAGKSKVELAHFAAAKEVFKGVRSGANLRSKQFSTRKNWTADIYAKVDGKELVIEYDGAYWHSAPAKIITDERKSLDLLAAGYLVMRLREDDLPQLPIDHHHYREIRVYSTAPRAQTVMAEIAGWLKRL